MNAGGTVDWVALQAPFHNDDIEWRVQGKPTKNKTYLVLPYVTNRAIQQRLDDVVGPAGWTNMFIKGPGGGVMCGISIGGVTKWDGADHTDIEAVKGGLSDAMKRAAVQWGIGRYLYSLPKFYVKAQKSGKYYTRDFGAWDPPPISVRRARCKPPSDKPDPGSGNGACPAVRLKAALAYFEKKGIFEGELEDHVQKKVALWTDADIETLKSIYGL